MKWSKRKAHRLNAVMANENANSRCDGAVLNLTCSKSSRAAAAHACMAPGVAEKLKVRAIDVMLKTVEGCRRRRKR
jgi:hypothetical protein